MTQSEKIERQIKDLDSQEIQLRTENSSVINQYKEYEEHYHEIFSARQKFKKQLVEAKLDENPNDIEFLLKFDPEAETNKSHDVLGVLATQYGLQHAGGHWVKTSQFVLQVRLNHHQSYEKALEGIKFFLPYIKPNDDGYAYFDIFEHTLSEYGSYLLKVKPDASGAMITRQNREWFSGSLEGCLHKISEKLWYE